MSQKVEHVATHHIELLSNLSPSRSERTQFSAGCVGTLIYPNRLRREILVLILRGRYIHASLPPIGK